MRVWRIAHEEVALDKGCQASADTGGHWNEKGVRALYAGASVELCALEKFVHLNGDDEEGRFALVAVDLPDDPDLGREAGLDSLPSDWCDMPDSPGAVKFGTAFLNSRSHLWLRVPSTIIVEARNIIVNPAHPAYDQVRLQIVRPFEFDPRMFKR